MNKQIAKILPKEIVFNSVLSYIYKRFEGIMQERYNNDPETNKLISAVISTQPSSISDASIRIKILKDIVFKQDFEPVLLAIKRIINITKKHVEGDIKIELFKTEAERDLYNIYIKISNEIELALKERDYAKYTELVKQLVNPINDFFDKVLIMDDNIDIRNNRLNLLAKIKNLVMQVLDITKIL